MTTAPHIVTEAAETVTQPTRHVLELPDGCACGLCAPVWMRRRGNQKKFTEQVSLAAAMDREDRAAWPAMVAEHTAYVMALTTAAAVVIEEEQDDEDGLGLPECGLPLLMFAGELAGVLQPALHRDQLPAGLVVASQQAVTAATFIVSGCMAGLADALGARPQMSRALEVYQN